MTVEATASTHIAPNPSETNSHGEFSEFTELDCLAVYLGRERGTSIPIEELEKLLTSNMTAHAIAVGRSELIEKNKKHYMFCEYGDRAAHDIMRNLRSDWPAQAPFMGPEHILSLWVMDELEDSVNQATERAKAERRAVFEAEMVRFGKRLTVEQARRFVSSELDLSMRETIRRTLGFTPDQVLALAA